LQGGEEEGSSTGVFRSADSSSAFDLESATPVELRARLLALTEGFRKLQEDNEAFRERTTRNLARRLDQRHERLLTTFIDILDNFDRALDAAEKTFAGAPLVEGLILVRSQLLQTLQEEGLERVPAIGHPYDPAVSEVVETQPVSDPDHHHIVLKELMRGYRLNGKLARPSRVLVGEYLPDAAEAARLHAGVAEPLIGADEDGLGDVLGSSSDAGTGSTGDEDGLSLDDIIAGVEKVEKKPEKPSDTGTLDLDELEREMREIFGDES